MPKYLALTPQQAAEVKQFGAEPSEYVYEEESGEAVPKAEVPMTLTEQIGAGLKSFIPGVTDTILAAPTLIGQTGDLVRQAQGTYDPYDRSDITQGTQAIKDYIVDTVGAPDPRAHWLSTGIGRGAGNLLSFMAGGGLARKGASFAMRKAGEEAAKKAAERAAKYTVAGLGGTLMGSSTVEREMDRQQDVGVQDPLKTAAKGLISGIGGGYIEQKLGAGLLLRNLLSPTKRLGSRLGQAILPGFAGGASTEGLQQGLENELVTEGSLQLGDPNYDPVRAAIVGGIVQGGSAMALSGGRKPAAPQEGADPAAQPAEQAAGMVGLRTGRVKPSATPEDTQGAPMYEPTPGVAEAMLKAGVNWDPPIKTPVDAAYKKLAEKGVIVTPEDIHQLYNIWGGKAENAKAVESAANGIYSRNVMNDVQKPKSTLDIVNAQLAVREKYDSTRGNLQKKLADLDSKDEKLQKSITENPTAIGTITAANAELARNAAQRKNYEAMLGELDNQEMLELSASQPVLPTRGMESPRVPIAALPDAGTTDTYSGAPGRPLGPAIPTRDAVPTAGEQQVAQTLQDYAADAGTVGLSTPMDPARAKALQEQRAQQEGEQGSPFGDAEARYSGLPLHWKAYIKGGVDRLVKNPDGSLKRFYHGTYKKFPDSAIGFKRGSEKSKAASVFVTDNEEAAKLFGDRVVPVYLEEGAYTKRPHSYNIFDAGRADESFDEYQVDDLTAIVPAVKEGSTFGESSTRYSGFDLRPMLEAGKEALRRGRKWLTPDQVQDGTFMLSGVAGLNQERPWGMQVGKSGELPVSGLVPKMAANIPKGEMEVYRAAGLEEWLEGKGKVSREELQQWMRDNGPVVEVKELRPQRQSKSAIRRAQILHEMDTRYPNWRDTLDDSPSWPPEQRQLFDAYKAAANSPDAIVPISADEGSTIGRYKIEPRPAEEMEGPVELLVRVPWGKHNPNNNTYDNIQWTGGHHGTSGYNTLGFGRANVETLPDGRKVLHVFEAQSDWGQRVRKEQEKGESSTPSHPLLDESNRLILKAGIKYALDNNLDGIAISDGETAMITEGHDAAAKMVRKASLEEAAAWMRSNGHLQPIEGWTAYFGDDWHRGTFAFVDIPGVSTPPLVRVDKPEANIQHRNIAREIHDAGYGQKEGAYIPQEGGMRLNYDQKLPKIAKELTGHEGERVSFGEHWKAFDSEYEAQGQRTLPDGRVVPAELKRPPRKNLIFKNPDGSPKTDITARVYPLDKARKMFEDQTAFTLFGRDQSYYSGLPLEWVNDLFKSMGLKNLGSPDPLYHLGKSVTSRMATRGPSGGLVKWLFADMTREKQKIANVLMEMTEPFRGFVGSENGIKWINRASTDETWDDYSGLSKEEIPAAEAYGQFWSDLRDLITDRGVYVMEIDPATGKVTPRPGAKLPGYTPWAVGDHIYEMAGDKNREAEWKQAQEDFVEKWKEKFGEGSDETARTAIANLLGVKGMETGPGGEPLFGPVSLPHGMTLPESWRDKRPADSLNRYIRRVSQHLAWAEKVQYNPAARRVFNIKADPMGVDTSKTDPTTWAEAPEAWAYAVREGKRVRADWALEMDEKNPPDEPIDFAGDSANMNALLSSFKQASSPNPNLQAFSSAASAALMQAPTGLRDVGMSLVRAAQYAGPSAALRASMDYIANIPTKLKEARQAGAMPGDLLEPEIVANSKAIARSMMKLARKLRTWSGREFLDNTGRVIIYDAVKAVILEGNGDHLVQEFGPAYSEGLSKDEIASQTAAVLSHRASNVSDAGSLPAGMLPQGGGLSAPLSLMRWSVAQYNTFAEDVVNPMLEGKGELGMKRFLTLVLGSIVGGSVINGLLDDLLKRKPDHLTWGEWLNVYNDPKVDKATKAKEFAYTAASRAQVMGALGWVGDYLVAPAAREIAGGTRWANQTDIQYPAWIVGNQMAQTIGSYYNAVVNKRTDGSDFLEFLGELGKINQNVRVAQGAVKAMQGEEKKGLRDQGVIERVYGVNSSTGKPAALETGMGPVFRSDPFNFTRQAMGSEDLGKLEGFLESRRKTGNVPSLDTWSQDRRYYQALTRLIGEEEAKKRREIDRKMDQEVRKKNREIRRLSR